MAIMKTSKGRDKVFGLVQYSLELYLRCMEAASEPSSSF